MQRDDREAVYPWLGEPFVTREFAHALLTLYKQKREDTSMIPASYETLQRWLVQAKEEGATHVIIVCDTFDWSDYPVSVLPGEQVREKMEQYNGKNMQRIMEVYNLSLDIDAQLKEVKAWHDEVETWQATQAKGE